MRFYLDTEFIEDGRTIDLVSIAVVAENGQEFYRQNSQADFRNANNFVSENVLPKLWSCPKGIPGPRHVYGLCADNACVWRPKRVIRDELFAWVAGVMKDSGEEWEWYTSQAAMGVHRPEFWGYHADYDWVALCQLFGRMVDLPRKFPRYCRDLKQYAEYLGNPPLPPEGRDEHNALSDARWAREAYYYLRRYDLSISQNEREDLLAGKGNEQELSARPEREESGHIRGPQAGGYAEVAGGGDIERRVEQDRQERQAPVQEREVTDAGLC